jgi:hypothetical protein
MGLTLLGNEPMPSAENVVQIDGKYPGWSFDLAPGTKIYAPASGILEQRGAFKGENPEGYTGLMVGLKSGDVYQIFGPLLVPKPFPTKIRKGEYIGDVEEGLVWGVYQDGKAVPNPTTFTPKKGSNAGLFFLLGGILLVASKSKGR